MSRVTLKSVLATMALLLAAHAGAGDAPAQATLASVFQDGMVLQRDMPVTVWGMAAPGTRVHVKFAGQAGVRIGQHHRKPLPGVPSHRAALLHFGFQQARGGAEDLVADDPTVL